MPTHDSPEVAPCTDIGDLSSQPAAITVLTGILLGRRYRLAGVLTIGRSPEADILVEDPEVSRHHARVGRDGDGSFFAEDLGSRNGTLLNGARISRAPLDFGDKLTVGSTSMVFARHDELDDERAHRHRLEMLGRLSAGMVHDLNNALSIVASSVAFLRGQRSSWPPAEAECLEDIQAASDRAAQLSRQLVAFARGSGGSPYLVDVAAVCTETVKLARRTFPQNIELRARLQPGLTVRAESAYLHQILMNLCVNARDAVAGTGRPGLITVESRLVELQTGCPERVVELEVSDDGAGMDESTRARIFEPFFTTKGPGSGSGLGLAMVSELVTQLGGRIRVDSSLGVGTKFCIELPEAIAGSRGERSSARASPTWRGARRAGRDERVLVVDDDAGVRRSFARVLRRAGFAVREASDGSEALNALESADSPFHILLLDLDMPRITGEEVIGEVKKKYPMLPVIVASGHTGPETLARVRAHGAYAVIAKPPAPDELVGCVCQALDDTRRSYLEENTLSGLR